MHRYVCACVDVCVGMYVLVVVSSYIICYVLLLAYYFILLFAQSIIIAGFKFIFHFCPIVLFISNKSNVLL